jgi:hypothetical protein
LRQRREIKKIAKSKPAETNSSWLNRIEAQFTALRYFTLHGTDHASHKEQASTIRRYIIWRNNHAYDERLRRIVAKVNAALCGSRSRRRAVRRLWPGVCGGLCRWTARPSYAGPHGLGTTDGAGSFAAQTVMLAVAAFLAPTRHPSVRR